MWNDDRVERLVKLYGEGLSASIIADRLGGVTRNAVIGKCHRLGLTGRAALVAKPKHNQNRKRPRSQSVKIAPSKSKVVRLGNTAFRRLLETTEPLPPPAETDIPRVSFRDLDRRQHCGWVCVEAQKGELIASLDAPVYCGCKPVPGLSYCEHHARRAFNVTPNAMLGSTRPDASANLRKHARTALARADIKVDPRTLEEVEA